MLTVASVNVNGVRAAVRWSWRGKAFDLDSGWRIDYQIASPGLAARAVKAEIDRAPSYAERWSDHAPVVVLYDLDPA